MKKILITGAMGQLGSELTTVLRDHYGANNVIGTDIRRPEEIARMRGISLTKVFNG